MSKQDSNVNKYTATEKRLLALEKKYTDLLADFMGSEFFINHMKKMFIDLNNDTERVRNMYSGPNFLSTPAERFVSYCLYHEFLQRKQKGIEEFEEVECYSYPICGDIAIELKEVVLSIEVKTVSRDANRSDFESLPFVPNQISFTNYVSYHHFDESTGYKPTFAIQGKLPQYHEGKPILSYIIMIIYEYDKEEANLPFKFFNSDNEEVCLGCTALNLFCIPNGKLARLFGENIFQGVKTYTYYDEKPSNGEYYQKIKLNADTFPDLRSCTRDIQKTYDYLYGNVSKINDNWKIANVTDYVVMIDTEHIGQEKHESKGILWILTTQQDTNKKMRPYMRAVAGPKSCRIDWKSNLVKRFDENGDEWAGVRHITIN